jgi:geranylgeranyl reductase family protein
VEHCYEVIIVGAGPAGSMLAYELSRTGTSVLLIEKQALPRYKCCAGGVMARSAKLLPIDINELAEDVVSSAEINYKGECRYRGYYDKELVYMVMRDKFDYALTQKAEEAGTKILQGQPVTRIRSNATGVEVYTPMGVFRSQFLVGADGVHSIVARETGLNHNVTYVAGMNAEIKADEQELMRWRNRISIDFGCIRGGYAWVFPKAGHLSIGIGCISSGAKNLKRCYRQLLDSLNMSHNSVIRWGGGLIPTCSGEPTLSNDRIALVGDAAGLADPLSGDGIGNAIESALLAAPVIKDCLLQGKANLEDYQQAVNEKIVPNIRIARVLQRIFTFFPEIFIKLLDMDSRVWKGCCYMMRGELDYMIAKQKVGGYKRMGAFMLKALAGSKNVGTKAVRKSNMSS